MVYEIEQTDLIKIKNILDSMEETRYFSIDPVKLNAIQLLSEQIDFLKEDIDQAIEDGLENDDFNEVLQLYLYDKDYT